MKILKLLLCVVLLSGLTLATADEGKKSTKRAAKRSTTTMQGCVDQRGEQYVLTGDVQLKKKAVLKGGAMSEDNFARYIGHKVKVEGALKTGSDMDVLSVDRIESIADTCTSQ